MAATTARPAQPAKPAQTIKPGQAAKTKAGSAKPKKKISGGAVLAIFLIVVMIAAAALVYLNVGGLREKLVAVLQTEQTSDSADSSAPDAAELEQKQQELDKQAADLTAQSDKLKQKSKDLGDKEKTLADKEKELTTREEAVTSAEASAKQTQQTQDDLTATAKVFEAMEPAVAATAISGLDSVDDMVALLLKMPSDTAAAIVSNMDAKLATKVLSEMMK